MKELFEARRLSGEIRLSLGDGRTWIANKSNLIGAIIRIVEKYQEEGYKLTLRQLYYQLVAADIIPNHDKVYKKISSVLDDCRYSGIIDWSAIEDRGRVANTPFNVEGIPEALQLIADQYRLDRQSGQQVHIEVWTEKDAISGILAGITEQYGITLRVNKGYTSSSAMYSAYQEFAGQVGKGRKVVILYFGDHDPSGLDMVRDIRERLQFMFNNGDERKDLFHKMWYWAEDNGYELKMSEPPTTEELSALQKGMIAFFDEQVQVLHIGLTREQIEELNPPPNPAKITDPRAVWYIKEHGKKSWEVDALAPADMERIVEHSIRQYIDAVTYRDVLIREDDERKEILKVATSYKKKGRKKK